MHRVLLFVLAGTLAFIALRDLEVKWAEQGRKALDQEAAAEARALEPEESSDGESSIPEGPPIWSASAPRGALTSSGSGVEAPSPDPARSPSGSGDPVAPRSGFPYPSEPGKDPAEGSRRGFFSLADRTPGAEDVAADSEPPEAVLEAWGTILAESTTRTGEDFWVGMMHLELVPLSGLDLEARGERRARTAREISGLLADERGTPLEAIEILYGLGWTGRSERPWSMRPGSLEPPRGRWPESGGAGLPAGEYRLRLWLPGSNESWDGRLILQQRPLPPHR